MPDPDLYAEFISVPHLLPQQWDSLQTTLNLQPNPSVDFAKTCFAVRLALVRLPADLKKMNEEEI